MISCRHPTAPMHIDHTVQKTIEAVVALLVPGSLFRIDEKLYEIGDWCMHGLLHVQVMDATALDHVMTLQFEQGKAPKAFHS